MDAYVVRHRQTGRPGQSEAVCAGKPERLGIVRRVEVELLVLEPDVHAFEDVDAEARTPGDVLSLSSSLRLPMGEVTSTSVL